MPRLIAALGLAACACAGDAKHDDENAPLPPEPLPRVPALDARFEKITLHREFLCEGASFGDFNRDGVMDVVAGPDWYEGPGYGARHALWTRSEFDPHAYSDCFFQFVHDFDGDDFADVLLVGFPGLPAAWYENPGSASGTWRRHELGAAPIDNESPTFVDLTGDGAPELVHMSAGALGWSSPDGAPDEPWVFHALSEPRGYVTFTHGLGVGDLDGDDRADALEAGGYFLQPEGADSTWPRVEQPFGSGGAQMPVVDLDDDGDADVVTALAAHGYGLSWFEQTTTTPTPSFSEHVIVPGSAAAEDAQVVLHEPHALALADIDGDGLNDIVAGERFWGHVPAGTPDPAAPARLYWFAAERGANGVAFRPTLIDDDSGVGTQLSVGDLDANGSVDIVVSNKKGAFVFLQTAP